MEIKIKKTWSVVRFSRFLTFTFLSELSLQEPDVQKTKWEFFLWLTFTKFTNVRIYALLILPGLHSRLFYRDLVFIVYLKLTQLQLTNWRLGALSLFKILLTLLSPMLFCFLEQHVLEVRLKSPKQSIYKLWWQWFYVFDDDSKKHVTLIPPL